VLRLRMTFGFSRFVKTGIVMVLACGLFAVACSSGLIKSLGGLNALRQHLIQKYHDEVSVTLQNSQFLSIVFVNSPLNNMDADKRANRAGETARFVALDYEGIKSIEQIWISFVESETHLIVLHETRSLDSFGFDKNGSPLGDESKKENDARAPVIKFNPARNETDISLTRIQLEGDMDHGIALVPHFTVSGDARQSATAAPETVTLDFASYARSPLFTENAPLDIYCNQRLAIKGFAQLMPASAGGTDESIAQFLSARITFGSFQKMAAARSVKIKLGSKVFELLPDDIQALARMSAYVRGAETSSEP